MKVTRTQTLHVTIATTNTAQRVTNDRKATFRKVYIYSAKTAPANAPSTENDNDCWIAKVGEGNRRFNSKIPANPGGQGDTAPFTHLVPDVLPEQPVSDLYIYGTAGDGVVVEWDSAFIDRDINDEPTGPTTKLSFSEQLRQSTALFVLFFAISASAFDTVPKPATIPQTRAGVSRTTFVTPYDLLQAGLLGDNSILVLSNTTLYPAANWDAGMAILTNLTPSSGAMFLGSGTFNATNSTHVPTVVIGQGVSTIVTNWDTDLATASLLMITNGGYYANFNVVFGYGSSYSGVQAVFWNGGASVECTIDNVNVLNANSDILYSNGTITDGWVTVRNCNWTSAFDSIFYATSAQSGTGGFRLRNCVFNNIGPNLTGGFDGSNAQNIQGGGATFDIVGCTFIANNTNSYNISAQGNFSKLIISGCTFTNFHADGSTATNIFFKGRRQSGGRLHLYGNDIDLALISISQSGTQYPDVVIKGLQYSTNYNAAVNANGFTNSSGVTQFANVTGTSGTYVYYLASTNHGLGTAAIPIYTNTVDPNGTVIPVMNNCGVQVVTGVGVSIQTFPAQQ